MRIKFKFSSRGIIMWFLVRLHNANRRIIKRLHGGENIPKFYGVAYRKYDYDIAICLPIPFNLIVKLIRNLFIRLKFPKYSQYEKKFNNELNEHFRRGWNCGRGGAYVNGFEDGLLAVTDFYGLPSVEVRKNI